MSITGRQRIAGFRDHVRIPRGPNQRTARAGMLGIYEYGDAASCCRIGVSCDEEMARSVKRWRRTAASLRQATVPVRLAR